MRAGEFDFFFNRCTSAANIRLYCCFKRFKALGGMMEILDRFMKLACREIRKQTLEFTECKCRVIELICIFGCIKRNGILDKLINSEVILLVFFMVILTLDSSHESEGFTVGISALRLYFFTEKIAYLCDVFHNCGRILENVAVDSLENIPRLTAGNISVVDVSVSIR